MNFLQQDQLASFDLQLKDVRSDEFIVIDSYNEIMIKDKIDKMPKEIITILLKIAIHIAIIGVGNKNYGKIMVNNKETEVKELLIKNNIKLSNSNAKLEPTDLTPGRLTRFFRFQIKKFIKLHNRQSYMYKYSNFDEKFVDICFRGAEYLIEKEEEANFLLNTAKNISHRKNFNLVEKIVRVFNARNIPYNHEYLNFT